MSNRIVGIDLGTTHSLIATLDSGFPYVIASESGERLTPSVVYFPPSGNSPLVGAAAVRAGSTDPERTVYSIKRFMGRRLDEIPEQEKLVSYPITGNPGSPAKVLIDGREWSPEEISAEILKKLKSDAEAALGETVERAVITTPAYFNDAQRSATKRAGELAGFTVERIINEPTAAALAYGVNLSGNRSKIAVYDLGGGTFDCSILELNDGIFQTLSTAGNTRLGGDDIDENLTQWLSQKIQKDSGWNPSSDPVSLSRIREQARSAKVQLSDKESIVIRFPFLRPDYSFEITISREILEELAQNVIQQIRSHCLKALSDAGLKPVDLDQVLLVGGQTRMPLVRKLVHQWFECSDFEEVSGGIRIGEDYHTAEGPQLNTSQNPDQAIALGAAVQAGILSGAFDHITLLDITPLSLGIETFGGLMNVIIPRNTTIPTKAGEMFTTAVDQQKNMLIHVLQGERERAKDNWTLGKFEIDFSPAPRGFARVGVQFEIDANGILHALARDTHTGHEKVVEIRSAVDVDDEKVQQMVEESVEYAFDDWNSRRWVEAKMKAQEIIAATQLGLKEYRADLEEDYAESLETALNRTIQILDNEDPQTESGDLNALKEAIANLDEISKPLAEHMMDQAMEAMLASQEMINSGSID
jgi:molecular chaperone DnaK